MCFISWEINKKIISFPVKHPVDANYFRKSKNSGWATLSSMIELEEDSRPSIAGLKVLTTSSTINSNASCLSSSLTVFLFVSVWAATINKLLQLAWFGRLLFEWNPRIFRYSNFKFWSKERGRQGRALRNKIWSWKSLMFGINHRDNAA